MGESFTTIIVIFLAAGLLFIFPMSAISQLNDKEVLTVVQSYTTEYGNKIATTGRITQSDYYEFIQKLNATGNSYDIELELHIADSNPSKKTENQQVGDTMYYILYHPQVMEKLNNGILLKEGDYIVVYVKNNNTTIAQMFMGLFYGLSGDESYSIFTQYSGPVLVTAAQ